MSTVEDKLEKLRKIVNNMRIVRTGDIILPEDHNLFVEFANLAADLINMLQMRPPQRYITQETLYQFLRQNTIDKHELIIRPSPEWRDSMMFTLEIVDLIKNFFLQRSGVDIMDYTIFVVKTVTVAEMPPAPTIYIPDRFIGQIPER